MSRKSGNRFSDKDMRHSIKTDRRGPGRPIAMAQSEVRQDLVYVAPEAADAFVRQLLVVHKVPDTDAVIIADCLVSADLRGVDTHGICRLPGYLDRVRRGLINARPTLKPQRITPVAAALDGQDGFGFVVGMRAMDEAMAMARDFGVGL